MQIDRTDKRGNRVEGRVLRGCWRVKESVRDMARDKNALDAHINPCDRQIWKINPPVFFPFSDMRLENKTKNSVAFAEVTFMVLSVLETKTKNSVAFAEVTFMILSVIFKRYFGVEVQEWRKEGVL